MLEILGAALLVVSALRSRAKIKHIRDTYETDLAEKLRDTIANQAITELWGFALLFIGLMMQMIGGFR
ncbi:MAG: hypothetical protein AB7U99_04410 [Steroidobacteraceae bacterium]